MATKSDLRLLTYNVYLRPPLIHSGKSDFKESRLAYIISNILPSYDVIAFQECFSSFCTRRTRLKAAAKSNGMSYIAECPVPYFWAGVDGGVVVLSRREITESRWFGFPRGVHSDMLADKGLLYSKIMASPTSTLHLFTTHLQASYHPPDTPNTDTSSIAARLNQIHCMKKHISVIVQANYKPSDTVLLVGDLNVDALDGDEYTHLIEILGGNEENGKESNVKFRVRDVALEKMGVHPVTTGAIMMGEEPFEKKCLDYIFELVPEQNVESGWEFEDTQVVKFRVEPSKDGWNHASDHFGVSAMICPPRAVAHIK